MTKINNRELMTNLMYSFGCCLQNSICNQITLKEKYGIETEIKVGSLGFGMKERVFFEYGYLDEKVFEKKYNSGNNRFDLHFWLEDKEGNIIDCYYYNYNFICEIQNVKCLFKQHSLIRHKKEMLKRMGVHYVELTNKKLIREASRNVLKSCCKDQKTVNKHIKNIKLFQ